MSTISYQPGYKEEQERRRKQEAEQYKGRGKYKRVKHKYSITWYDKNGKELSSDTRYGWQQVLAVRKGYRSIHKGWYRVRVYNETTGRKVK